MLYRHRFSDIRRRHVEHDCTARRRRRLERRLAEERAAGTPEGITLVALHRSQHGTARHDTTQSSHTVSARQPAGTARAHISAGRLGRRGRGTRALRRVAEYDALATALRGLDLSEAASKHPRTHRPCNTLHAQARTSTESCNRATVQPCNRATVQPCNRATVQPCNRATVQHQ